MQICPNCEQLVQERLEVCPICGHIIRFDPDSLLKRPDYLLSFSSKERPGCVTAAAIIMALSAIPPALKSLSVLTVIGRDSDFFLFLAYLWGDIILSLVLAWGLWHLKNWARILVIILLSLAVVGGLVVSDLGGIILLVIFGYIIYWFAAHGEYFTSKANTPHKTNNAQEFFYKANTPDKTDNAQEFSYRQPSIASYFIGTIGIILGLWGLQALLVDSNALGLYFGLIPGVILFVVALGLNGYLYAILGEKGLKIVGAVLGVAVLILGLVVLLGMWQSNIRFKQQQREQAATAIVVEATSKVKQATAQVIQATANAIQTATKTTQAADTARVLIRRLDLLNQAWKCKQAAYSPDGKKLVITGKDSIIVLDMSKEEHILHKIPLEEGQADNVNRVISGVSYSPDGLRLAGVNNAGVVKIWDTQTWQQLLILTIYPDRYWHSNYKVRYSPDGQRIITGGDRESEAIVWDVVTGKQLLALDHDKVEDLIYSPDGRYIITANISNVKIWDAITGKEFVTHPVGANSLVYSPDGDSIITVRRGSNIATIWDAVTWQSKLTVSGNDRLVYAAFSPDESHIITADRDEEAKIWDVTDGQEIATLKHKDRVDFAAYSPDGHRLVTLSRCQIMIWDVFALQKGGIYFAENE